MPSQRSSIIVKAVKSLYPNVRLKPPLQLPAEAWYEPRKRYRADSLIKWLKKIAPEGSVVIGITSRDISTTKNEVKDYGIMGLGINPGNASVASTFRLNKKKTTEQLFKIVIHELGHNFGLSLY